MIFSAESLIIAGESMDVQRGGECGRLGREFTRMNTNQIRFEFQDNSRVSRRFAARALTLVSARRPREVPPQLLHQRPWPRGGCAASRFQTPWSWRPKPRDHT